MAAQVKKSFILGDFHLETETRLLVRNGETVHLPKRPFEVLVYLIEHRDQMVSRRELLDLFWEGREVYDVTLTKCVGRIRKALSDHLDNPHFIETRYAEGYRFIGPLEDRLVTTEPRIVEAEEAGGAKPFGEGKDDQENSRANGQPEPHRGARTLRVGARKSSRRIMTPAFIAAVLTICALAVYGIRSRFPSPVRASQPAPSSIGSIAVMPLKNLSGDPSQDYFSDGLTESLINKLSKIRGLRVISRSSVFTLNAKEVDPHEVGTKLGVAALLEGNVRKTADDVRVEVRLVSTQDGRVLWATDNHDRGQGDVFAIQDEIARGVASGLTLKLNGPEEQQVAKRYTNSGEAYEDYLKGRYFWNKRTKDDLLKAVEYFQSAIARDSQFGLAYAGLAETYAVMEMNASVPPGTAAPKAEENASKALQLDNTLAGAYAALGLVRSFSDWNWQEGKEMFERALAVDPGYATARQWYAANLLAMGQFEQAENQLKRARESDPLSLPIANSLAETYYYWRQNERCITQSKNILELYPTNENAYWLLGRVYMQMGMREEAIKAFLKLSDARGGRAIVFAGSGRQDKARQIISQLANSSWASNNPCCVAALYSALGDKEEAFAWLEKAYSSHQADLASFKVDPIFDPLRSDARFADLLRRVGLS